ncbi:hypothetical protein C5167_016669 [Papaver somniferum]|nr:hypothetical protein C5167_016669 [Papaver somniferum]
MYPLIIKECVNKLTQVTILINVMDVKWSQRGGAGVRNDVGKEINFQDNINEIKANPTGEDIWLNLYYLQRELPIIIYSTFQNKVSLSCMGHPSTFNLQDGLPKVVVRACVKDLILLANYKFLKLSVALQLLLPTAMDLIFSDIVPWSVRRENLSEKERVLKTLKGIFNKLTPEKFDLLKGQLIDSGITTQDILQITKFCC